MLFDTMTAVPKEKKKNFPPLLCDNFLPGAADLTCTLLLEPPLLFVSDSSPLVGGGLPERYRVVVCPNPSLSAKRLIVI